jgi:hypothetical protein
MIRPPAGLPLLAACSLVALAAGCSSSQKDSCGGCPVGEACLGVPLADGGLDPQCGTLSQAFGPCGYSPPAACAEADLTCVASNGSNGICYQLCDPSSPACDGGLPCLAVLSTADVGICAQPTSSDAGCDQSQQIFCPVGQVCLGAGNCLKRCDPTLAIDCPQLESCVTPSPFDPGLSICVQPQPIGSACSPASSIYCVNGAFCVSLVDAGNRCLQDCTDGGVCPLTQDCRAISDQNMTLVLGVCY